jgi:anti-sigma factor RsiW
MTQKDLKNEWARLQIEAYVDGSLDAEDRDRMQAAMADNAPLRASVERARAVHGELRRMAGRGTPRGLLWRLLAIPRSSPRPAAGRSWAWLAAPVMAAALVAAVALRLGGPAAPLTPAPDARAAAVQEFALAMAYLQRSAEVTQRNVNGAVVFGFNEALTVGRDTVLEDESENGG